MLDLIRTDNLSDATITICLEYSSLHMREGGREKRMGDLDLIKAQDSFTDATTGINTAFNEIIWYYPSANASQIDRAVAYNYLENTWRTSI